MVNFDESDTKLPPVAEERRVVPYDPLVTIKKAMRAALISAAALVGGALLDALLQGDILKQLLEQTGVSGMLIMVAVPVLHALGTALQNWLKTRKGVPYERREEFRKDIDHAPKVKKGQKLVQPSKQDGGPQEF